MSLRTFHLLFILVCIVGADVYGVWSIWMYRSTGDGLTLALGIASFLGGLGLVWYAFRLVQKLDRAHIG